MPKVLTDLEKKNLDLFSNVVFSFFLTMFIYIFYKAIIIGYEKLFSEKPKNLPKNLPKSVTQTKVKKLDAPASQKETTKLQKQPLNTFNTPQEKEKEKNQRRKRKKVVLAASLTESATPKDTSESELQVQKKTKKKTRKKQQLESQDYFATQTTSADTPQAIPDTTYVVAFDTPAQATDILEQQPPSDNQTTSTVTSTLSEITKDPSEGRSKSYINKQGEEIKLPLNKKGEVTYKIKKSGIGKLSIHPDLLDTLDFIQIKKLNDLCDRSNVLEECENTKGKNCIFKINQENKKNEKSKDKGDNEQYKLFLKICNEDYRFFARQKEPNKSKDPSKRKSKNFENYIVTGYLPSHKTQEKIISFPKKPKNESISLEGNSLELNLNKSIKK